MLIAPVTAIVVGTHVTVRVWLAAAARNMISTRTSQRTEHVKSSGGSEDLEVGDDRKATQLERILPCAFASGPVGAG
jgi:hypothetical protein